MTEEGGAGGWSTIESDAGLFTSLIEQLGVNDVQFEELISLDADSIRSLSPVYGVIFLFKYLSPKSQDTARPEDGTYDTEADGSDMFFAAQTIQNACGTQAILSVILNNDDPSSDPHITLGPSLRSFKEFTTGFPPDLCGEALSNSEPIREVHNSFARSSPFADETQKDSFAGTEDVFHFIGFTSHNDTLYELDGLHPHPISHGSCTKEEFPDKIIPVLTRRIARYPEGEVRFNLMALCGDLRKKAEAFGDFDMLEREKRKRRNWEWENALRRHNFVGFTGEVLKGVVGHKLQNGIYDEWVKGAEQTTRRRVEERARRGQGMEGLQE